MALRGRRSMRPIYKTIDARDLLRGKERRRVYSLGLQCRRFGMRSARAELSIGFVHFNLAMMEARVIDTKHASKVISGLKIAMRELRTYPTLIGFVSFDDGKRCLLEVAWKEDSKKPTKDTFEDELLIAILRRRQTPLTFW